MRRSLARWSWLAVFVASVLACTPVPRVDRLEFDEDLPTFAPLPIDPVPDDAYIDMKRTGCFGDCPQYRVQITADGHVRWTGEEYVEAMGERTGDIGRAAFVELWSAIAASPWRELPATEPEFGSDMCHTRATDMSSVLVDVGAGRLRYRVHDYRGCDGNEAMKDFRQIEARIDDLTGTDRWIGE